MLIENESQWNTDDLRAIVKAVLVHNGHDPATYRPENLLVFKTSRRRHHERGGSRPRAAQQGYMRGGLGHQATVVELLSKEKLIEKNALERLAATTMTEGVVQDIAPCFIRDIAEQVHLSLTGKYSSAMIPGYEFAEKLQLRAAPKITRSVEVTKLKIEACEAEKVRINRHFSREIDKIDRQIASLRSKVPPGSV
jgi:hypothetical protein